MHIHKSHFSRGLLIGLVFAVVAELVLVSFGITACRDVAHKHPEAYFASRVSGVSGTYCQVVVSDSQKQFADDQKSLFSPTRSINNSSNALTSFVLFKLFHFAALASVLMLLGGFIGFFIERNGK